MLEGKKIVVVMPAFNAARTLERTFAEIPLTVVDDVILVDDASSDATAELARKLGITTVQHSRNRGYGANQKTCYAAALSRGADIVVMLHPDYQYSPRLVTAMTAMITSGHFDAVLGSRMLGRSAIKNGMPIYKFVSNRALTVVQNLLLNVKMSEFHTGFRAWSRELLLRLPLLNCSDDFVFDNQMLAQTIYFGFDVGEISCPASYLSDSSSIKFGESVVYGLGVLETSLQFRLKSLRLGHAAIFDDDERAKLSP